MSKKLYGYICGTDTTDIWLGANDVRIYSSIKDLKKERTCWKECGIYRIPLDSLKLVVKPTYKIKR